MLGNLRTATKLGLLMGTAALALIVAVLLGASFTYSRMMTDRVLQLRSVVDVAIKQVGAIESDVQAGRLSRPEAANVLSKTINAFRYGARDENYVFIDRMDGLSLANGGSQALVGKNTMELRDPTGLYFVREMVDKLKSAPDGVETYSFPKPNETVPTKKIVYFRRYEPCDCFVASGAYIDDISADFEDYLIKVGTACLVLLTMAGAVTVLITREITGSLAGLRARMGAIAGGNLDTDIPEERRGDEVGQMAKALGVFRSSLSEAHRVRLEQSATKEREAQEQHAARAQLANQFESHVGAMVGRLAAGATGLESTAQSMTETARQTNQQSTTVAAAAEQASVGVQTVASAAEELSTSISEIGRQVAQSAKITSRAVSDAQRTDVIVRSLADAAEKIGQVIGLITNIASQTNLLALNATIEAARAGDAGKGFAVVASEVKSLANQTARATEEIGAQIAQIQGATKEAVGAIRDITATIGEVSTIATTIAAAVEEQGSATAEIARNVQQTAQAAQEVTSNISGVSDTAGETGDAAGRLLLAATDLSKQAELLSVEVDSFVTVIRAA